MTDPTALPSFPSPEDTPTLRDRVLAAMRDLDADPTVGKDGVLMATVQGQRLLVRCAEGPMPLLRLFGQWRIGESAPADELSRLRAANQVTAGTNLVKVTVHGDVLVVAVDLVVPLQVPVRPLLQGAIQGVLVSVRKWNETVARPGGDAQGGEENADG